jgi:hypothetical protein
MNNNRHFFWRSPLFVVFTSLFIRELADAVFSGNQRQGQVLFDFEEDIFNLYRTSQCPDQNSKKQV